MTEREVAQVLNVFHGAYRTEVDEAMALVWVNVLDTTDLRDALAAASDWVLNESRFPTPAELLASIRKVKQARLHEEAERQSAIGAWRCDGTGWIPRTDDQPGLEPCPTCNPHLREHWKAGTWDSHRIPKPAEDYVQPPPCRPRRDPEADAPVSMPDHVREQLRQWGKGRKL